MGFFGLYFCFGISKAILNVAIMHYILYRVNWVLEAQRGEKNIANEFKRSVQVLSWGGLGWTANKMWFMWWSIASARLFVFLGVCLFVFSCICFAWSTVTSSDTKIPNRSFGVAAAIHLLFCHFWIIGDISKGYSFMMTIGFDAFLEVNIVAAAFFVGMVLCTGCGDGSVYPTAPMGLRNAVSGRLMKYLSHLVWLALLALKFSSPCVYVFLCSSYRIMSVLMNCGFCFVLVAYCSCSVWVLVRWAEVRWLDWVICVTMAMDQSHVQKQEVLGSRTLPEAGQKKNCDATMKGREL